MCSAKTGNIGSHIRCALFVLLTIIIIPPCSYAGDKERSASGFLDFNYYYDDRDFNVYTLNILAKPSESIEYFSFTNLFNSPDAKDNYDASNFYTEQNIRWTMVRDIPLQLSLQWSGTSGDSNDVFRLGARILVSKLGPFEKLFEILNGWYTVTFHLVQEDKIDGYNWQIEHVYYIRPIPGDFGQRLYISGFMDHNKYKNAGDKMVMEHQVGIRLVDKLFMVAEYRKNEFLKSGREGLGYGLEYLILF